MVRVEKPDAKAERIRRKKEAKRLVRAIATRAVTPESVTLFLSGRDARTETPASENCPQCLARRKTIAA